MRRKSRPVSSRNAQLGHNGLTILQILKIFYESASFFNQKNVSLFYLILAICQSKYRENSHKYNSANIKNVEILKLSTVINMSVLICKFYLKTFFFIII